MCFKLACYAVAKCQNALLFHHIFHDYLGIQIFLLDFPLLKKREAHQKKLKSKDCRDPPRISKHDNFTFFIRSPSLSLAASESARLLRPRNASAGGTGASGETCLHEVSVRRVFWSWEGFPGRTLLLFQALPVCLLSSGKDVVGFRFWRLAVCDATEGPEGVERGQERLGKKWE